MSDDLLARLIAESVAQDAHGDVARMTGESLPATESKSRAVADLLREAAAALRERVAPVDEHGVCDQCGQKLLPTEATWFHRGCLDAYYAERVADDRVAPVEASTFLLQTPSHARSGVPPIECRYYCMYTQVKPCRELYTDPDYWCGFCSEKTPNCAERVAPVEADPTVGHPAGCGCYECDTAPVKADTMTDLDTLAKDTWRDAKRKIIFHLPGEREQAERDAEGVILATLRRVSSPRCTCWQYRNDPHPPDPIPPCPVHQGPAAPVEADAKQRLLQEIHDVLDDVKQQLLKRK